MRLLNIFRGFVGGRLVVVMDQQGNDIGMSGVSSVFLSSEKRLSVVGTGQVRSERTKTELRAFIREAAGDFQLVDRCT